MSLTISRQQNGSALTIALAGRLDAQTAPSLDAEMQACPDAVRELVFDCTALSYVSSAGLRSFVNAYKAIGRKGGSLRIIHANDVVMKTLELTGLTGKLNIG